MVWEVGPHLRHTIPDLAVSHTLARHLPAGSVVAGASAALDWALLSAPPSSAASASSRKGGSSGGGGGGGGLAPGADVAAQRQAEAALDKLGKQLRALDGLALKVRRGGKGRRGGNGGRGRRACLYVAAVVPLPPANGAASPRNPPAPRPPAACRFVACAPSPDP